MSTGKNSTNLFGNLTGPTSDEDAAAEAAEQAAIDAQENETTMTPDENEVIGDDLELPDELTLLKQRAKMMGISFSPNIGLEALKAKVNAKLSEDEPKAEEPPVAEVPEFIPNPAFKAIAEQAEPVVAAPVRRAPAAQGPAAIRRAIVKENMRLVRIRITNLDPNDKDLQGNIFTVANEYLGTVSRFIPFGETTDNGWHVEYCLYKFLRAQKFLKITVKKVNGKEQVSTAWVRKFAIEELPQLTQKEIDTLKAAQLGAGNIGDD